MPLEKLVYQLTVRLTIKLVAAGSAAIGAGITLGGPGRFKVPALATAALIPGGCYTWAVAIAFAAALTFAGMAKGWQRHVVMAGLAGQGAWFAFFDMSLWVTAWNDPSAPLTGPCVYLMLAVICAVLYAAGHTLEAAAGRISRT